MQTEPLRILVTQARKAIDDCADPAAALKDLDDMIARGGVEVWAAGVTSLPRTGKGTGSRQPSGRVQPATWAVMRIGAADRTLWAKGTFSQASTATSPGIELSGIRLERAPVANLLREYGQDIDAPQQLAAPAIASTERDASDLPGGKVQWKKWERIWVAIVTLALEEKLNLSDIPTKAALMDAVREKTADDIFSDTTLKPFISKVFKKFIAPHAS